MRCQWKTVFHTRTLVDYISLFFLPNHQLIFTWLYVYKSWRVSGVIKLKHTFHWIYLFFVCRRDATRRKTEIKSRECLKIFSTHTYHITHHVCGKTHKLSLSGRILFSKVKRKNKNCLLYYIDPHRHTRSHTPSFVFESSKYSLTAKADTISY